MRWTTRPTSSRLFSTVSELVTRGENGKRAGDGLLKISELAAKTGAPLSTVKFYAREGLIKPARKTGRNMAYYEPACVDTIKVIQQLQKKRFYPLSVIKRLLETSSAKVIEMDLLDAIHKVDYLPSGGDVTAAQACKTSRLSAAQLNRLEREELVSPDGDARRRMFTPQDVSVMKLVRRRMDAGIPFEQTVNSLGIYRRSLREAARADVDSFIVGALMDGGFTAEKGAHMIRVSDETLDEFIAIKRTEFNREFGSRRVVDIDSFGGALALALGTLAKELASAGFEGAAALCDKAASGDKTGDAAFDETVEMFLSPSRASGGDVASSVAQALGAREYFARLEVDGGEPASLARLCLRACWLGLAPEILRCREGASSALADLAEYSRELPDGGSSKLAEAMRAVLKSSGGDL